MRRASLLAVGLALVSVTAACDPAGSRGDGDAGADSGHVPPSDGGNADAGVDAGPGEVDAGPKDGGPADASVPTESSATGSLGFDVFSARAVATPPYYVFVYLMQPDWTQKVCAGATDFLPNGKLAVLLFPYEADGGFPVGTFDLATGGVSIDRFDTGADGYEAPGTYFGSQSGSVTVAVLDGGTLVGEYAATLESAAGDAGTLSGRFFAPSCP